MKKYFNVPICDEISLIACEGEYMGNEIGKSLSFGLPTGNSWLINGQERALLIDSTSDLEGLREFVENIVNKEVCLILTHAHPDHTYRICEFDQFWVHHADECLLDGAYGWEKYQENIPSKINYLNGDERLRLGEGHYVKVIHIPGHTDGSIMLLDEKNKVLFSGDAIARRFLYGTCGFVSPVKYIEQLKNISEMDFCKICSCHDRQPLQKKHIDMMIEAMEIIPHSNQIINPFSDKEEIVAARIGNTEYEELYCEVVLPISLKEKYTKDMKGKCTERGKKC